MVTGMNEGKMHAFIADEGLARFCTELYSKPTKANFKKAFMHMTNYSLNKHSTDFVEDYMVDDILNPNEATKRTLAALWKELETA